MFLFNKLLNYTKNVTFHVRICFLVIEKLVKVGGVMILVFAKHDNNILYLSYSS